MTGPVVVKVGGSLLDWPELPLRVAQDLDARPGPVVLVDGAHHRIDLIRPRPPAACLGDAGQGAW